MKLGAVDTEVAVATEDRVAGELPTIDVVTDDDL